MGDPLIPIENYLSYSLAAAHRSVHLSLTNRLKALGVQVETWRILEVLDAEEGRTMGELAGIVLMNPPALTKLVDKMVADGLAHRQVAPEDHRRVNLLLTEMGRVLVARVRQHATEQNEEFMRKLGPEKVQALQEVLRALF